jgi:hypothetical protein
LQMHSLQRQSATTGSSLCMQPWLVEQVRGFVCYWESRQAQSAETTHMQEWQLRAWARQKGRSYICSECLLL